MKQQVGPPPNVVHPPGTLPYLPHNTVYFELCIHPVDGRLHVLDIAIDNPKKQDTMMPPMYVLQHVVKNCYPLMECHLNPEGVTVYFFMELLLHASIIRSNPVFHHDGAWLEYVMGTLKDTEGDPYTTVAQIELMYYLPSKPMQCFAMVHPAFQFCQAYILF
jgi:hypothetical protein